MFEKILVPLDGSDAARKILTPVEAIARAHASTVELVRVLDPGEIDDALLAGIFIFDDVREEFERALAPFEAAGLRTHWDTLEGTDAAQRLVDYAEAEGHGLIALATHGRSGRGERGAVAEKVLRRSKVPVLLASPHALAAWTKPRTILVPLDGSERAEAALSLAAAHARAFGAELLLVHVVDDAAPASALDAAEELLAAAGKKAGVPFRTLTKKGAPGPAIIAAAEDEHASLVALATHGRSGLARWIFGSVAEHVVAHARVPILVTRTVPIEGASTSPSPSTSTASR